MIDLTIVDQALAAADAEELDTTDLRLARVFSLSAADRFQEASEAALELWSAGFHDLRLLGALLYGAFDEQGVAALPDVFGALLRNLRDNWDFLAPHVRRETHADAAVKFLLSTMVRCLKLHEMQQDEIWKSLNGEEAAAPLFQTLRLFPDVQERLVNLMDRPRCLPFLQQLEAILTKLEESAESVNSGRSRRSSMSVSVRPEMLEVKEPAPPDAEGGEESSAESEESSESTDTSSEEPDTSSEEPATSSEEEVTSSEEPATSSAEEVTPSEEPAPEPTPESPDPSSAEPEESAESPDESSASDPAASAAAAAGESLTLPLSPPLAALLRRVAAFKTLMQRKDHRRAAVVAADVLKIMESFDPRVYLPSLFAGFYATVARHGDKLEPLLDQGQGLSVRALQQLYHMDIDAFVKGGR